VLTAVANSSSKRRVGHGHAGQGTLLIMVSGKLTAGPRARLATPLTIGLSILAVAALAAWAFWPASYLEIRLGQDGPVVKSLPISAGERIVYTYRHSVQLRPVVEILEAAPNGHLVVRETVYDMFGVGLPSDLPDGELTLDSVNGKFRITGMNRDIPVLLVRVAFTAEQTLEVRGEQFRLDSLAAPTTLLRVEMVTRPRISAFFR